MRGLVLGIVSLVSTAPALACPLCESPTGRQVRAGIFDGRFGSNLLATALPFLILLAIVALIHHGWPAPFARPDSATRKEVGGVTDGR